MNWRILMPILWVKGMNSIGYLTSIKKKYQISKFDCRKSQEILMISEEGMKKSAEQKFKGFQDSGRVKGQAF